MTPSGTTLAMAQRYARPDWVRRLNAMAGATGSAVHFVPIDAGALVDSARETTGIAEFDDLGDGDWEGRLRAVIASINASDLTVVGRLMTREELLRCLRTRLFLGAERRRNPAVADERIVAPIVVTGPARSGTTILFELLALDTGMRSPIATDVMHPALPDSIDPATRRAMTESEQELWADVQPEFAAIHELRADLPVECITITAPSFAGSHWSMVLDDPGAWMPEPAADFAFHKAVLQSVQHGKPQKQWLLKTPAYIFMLDDLLNAYPDASVVFSHRDTAKTMPSTVSTTTMVRWLRSDNLDVPALAELVDLIFTAGLNTVAERHLAGTLPDATGHVRFMDLMADAVAAIAPAYNAIGRDFSDSHRAAIVKYLADKPRGKHGRHDYTAEEWGFDVQALRKGAATYLSTFDIVSES
ncbi:MAG TPA: sulfotransferase [Mycobacteriales bacterium]|nr:sulfotransferase [Mycobacteriales bacterium]